MQDGERGREVGGSGGRGVMGVGLGRRGREFDLFFDGAAGDGRGDVGWLAGVHGVGRVGG